MAVGRRVCLLGIRLGGDVLSFINACMEMNCKEKGDRHTKKQVKRDQKKVRRGDRARARTRVEDFAPVCMNATREILFSGEPPR